MGTSLQPDIQLARRVLPAPLYKALIQIFSQNIADCMLVGGTALSGFYAGHRRSDDIDLFVKNETAFSQAVLAFRTLKKLGTLIKDSAHSNQYFKAICSLENHAFTVDIVLDENLFNEGRSVLCDNRVAVADLPTLFMMKSAALLSRCGEKDLYDLLWLFKNLENVGVPELLAKGAKMDGGMRPETVLYSVSSSRIRKEACGFSLDPGLDDKKIYSQISKFKKQLVGKMVDYVRENTKSDLKPVLDKIRNLE